MTPNPPRTRTACTACHAAKVRCTGTNPCARCTNSSLQCIYRISQVGRKRGRRPTPPDSTTSTTTLPSSVNPLFSPAPYGATPDFLNDPFFADFTMPSPPPAPQPSSSSSSSPSSLADDSPSMVLLRLHAALEAFDATQTVDHHLQLITSTLNTLVTMPLRVPPRTTRALLPTAVDLVITALKVAKNARPAAVYGVYQIDTGVDDGVLEAMKEVGMAAWRREMERCRMVVDMCREGARRGCAADRAVGDCAGAAPDERCLGERWWERIEGRLMEGWAVSG